MVEVNVGDVITVSWTAPDFDPGVTANATVKVTSIQTEPIVVIFGEQQ